MNSRYSLAISNTNNTVSVCVFEKTKMIHQIHDQVKDNKNVNRIFKVLNQLLETNNINYDDIAEIYISVGPGSFTAIRIGLALVIGLNIAKNIEVYGISNLQLMAYLASAKKDISLTKGYFLLDAQREQLFMQVIDIASLTELSDCELIDYNYLYKILHVPIIIDVEAHKKLKEKISDLNHSNINIINYNESTAFDIGQCGLLLKSLGLTKRLIPFYVRLPDAKPNNNV